MYKLHMIYVIKSRYYDMLFNKTFKCLILSKKCRVGLKNRVYQGSGYLDHMNIVEILKLRVNLTKSRVVEPMLVVIFNYYNYIRNKII